MKLTATVTFRLSEEESKKLDELKEAGYSYIKVFRSGINNFCPHCGKQLLRVDKIEE